MMLVDGKRRDTEMTMQELDRQALRAINTHTCPKCGAPLYPVIVDGACVGFDCLVCEEFHAYDNIATS